LEYEFAECTTKVQKMLRPRDPVLDRVGDISRPAALMAALSLYIQNNLSRQDREIGTCREK